MMKIQIMIKVDILKVCEVTIRMFTLEFDDSMNIRMVQTKIPTLKKADDININKET